MRSVLAKNGRGLWAYNIRILLGNSYWLIITPIAAAQVVLFWNMATAGFSSGARAAQTVEVLAPILGAFLCAYAVAPEHAGVGELVFTRPVSMEKLLLLRLAVVFAFVLAVFAVFLLFPLFAFYRANLEDLPIGMSLLAALVSTLFLSTLAMAISGATRQPLLALAVAGGFWAVDFALGSTLDPLVTLHGFADYVAMKPMSELWWANKLLLLGLAAVFYLWNRSLLGRPLAPRRALVVVRNSVLVAVLIFVYMAGGAVLKVSYGLKHEGELGNQAQMWYQQQFSPYGPVPVAWLFGPAFPLYVQAQVGRTIDTGESRGLVTPLDVGKMKLLLARYPRSIWADNAQYELARDRGRRATDQFQTVWVYEQGESSVDPRVVDTDYVGERREMRLLVKKYPQSVFAPLALVDDAQISLSLLDFDAATSAYERLLRNYPHSPQATEAGLALSALYTRRHQWEQAMKAADMAAAASHWDLRAQAYFAAAQAADRDGKREEARTRYEHARTAAEVMRTRAGGRIKSGTTRLTPAEIILTAEKIMNTCDRALSGKGSPRQIPGPGTATVTGRITRNGAGVPGVRVAMAAQIGERGALTPFVPASVVEATTDRNGVFRLEHVGLGPQRAIGFVLPAYAKNVDITGVKLPLQVTAAQTTLPDFVMKRRPPASRPQAPRTRGLQRGGGGGARGGGGRGGMGGGGRNGGGGGGLGGGRNGGGRGGNGRGRR